MYQMTLNLFYVGSLEIDTDVKRPNFQAKYALWRLSPGGVDKWYKQKQAKKSYDNFFKDLIPKLIQHDIVGQTEDAKENYFARNHVTPMGDFVLAEHQKLTFFFHNCFPGKKIY